MEDNQGHIGVQTQNSDFHLRSLSYDLNVAKMSELCEKVSNSELWFWNCRIQILIPRTFTDFCCEIYIHSAVEHHNSEFKLAVLSLHTDCRLVLWRLSAATVVNCPFNGFTVDHMIALIAVL